MTPRYYTIRINAHKFHDTPESASKEAESLPLGVGDEWGILELVGVTRRSVTTTWPALPPGHSYLNPENLTVEQLGDGWRPLCTLDETYPTDHQLSLTTGWAPAVPGILSKPNGRSITYRTRAPIPTLPYNP